LHLIKSPPKAIKSRLFLPLGLSHLNPETLPECEYEGRFFRGGLKKTGFLPGIRGAGAGAGDEKWEL
jgi:hypothetical protein